MPISPAAFEAMAQELRRIYAEAETEMIAAVARRLERGIEDEGWAERKLAEIRFVRRDVERQLRELRRSNRLIEQAVDQSYRAGSDEAITDLRQLVTGQPVATEFTATHRQAVLRLAARAVQAIEITHFRILREAEDVYRRVIAETVDQVLTGTQTRRQAAQAALDRFADAGVTGFVDRAGRRWDLASYAEMATRSASGQAAVQGHVDRLQANGRDLVIVSNSPEECPLCRPWEGRVLSISGSDPERPALATARGAGLFHPSCTHSLGLFTPGLTKPLEGTANPRGYAERQKQRYFERQIRKWKRREAAAITDDGRARAKAKVREWQARNREFVEEHDRRRKYEREQIKRAR